MFLQCSFRLASSSPLKWPLFSSKETEEPIVECQECETDTSSSRTAVGSSLTSGDLGDVSSFSSKASSLHRTSSGASSGHSATHSSSSARGTGAVKGKMCGAETGEFVLPIGRGTLGRLRYVQSFENGEGILQKSTAGLGEMWSKVDPKPRIFRKGSVLVNRNKEQSLYSHLFFLKE